MKNRILTVVTILIIVMAMTGIVTAKEGGQGVGGGCPSRNSLGSHTQTYDNLFASKTVAGTVVTYLLNTITNGQSVIGYCIYPTPGFEGSVDGLTPLYAGWEKWPKHDNKDYFGFERGTGGNEIPIDGTVNIQVGKADYESGPPTSEVILFHIKDPQECRSGDNSDESEDGSDTCWRRPGTPPPSPVPEIATIALVSAGIVGLFLVARKYRK